MCIAVDSCNFHNGRNFIFVVVAKILCWEAAWTCGNQLMEMEIEQYGWKTGDQNWWNPVYVWLLSTDIRSMAYGLIRNSWSMSMRICKV